MSHSLVLAGLLSYKGVLPEELPATSSAMLVMSVSLFWGADTRSAGD